MFIWLEKIVIKRIIKRISNELPELKEKALEYLEENKDEIIEKIKDLIIDFIKSKTNK